MTQPEIIYSIKEQLQVNSDDRAFDFTEPLILFIYEEARALIVSQNFNRAGRMVDTEFYQTIRIEMEKVDRTHCELVPVGCKILRSKEKLPSAIANLHNHALVDKFSSMDIMGKKYKFIEYTHAKSSTGGKFSYKYIYGFMLNGYLYVYSENKTVNAVSNLMLRAVFEEPSKVIDSGMCVGNDCTRYPMKMRFHTMATEIAVKKLLSKYQIPEDDINDADSTMGSSIAPQNANKAKSKS